jgi:MOSC domain-containing protein YiiM
VPELLSVNVGLPRDVSWQGRTVHTGVWKAPADGPVLLRRLNLDGDERRGPAVRRRPPGFGD